MAIFFDPQIGIPKDSSTLNELNSFSRNELFHLSIIRLRNKQILFFMFRRFLKSSTEKITLPPCG